MAKNGKKIKIKIMTFCVYCFFFFFTFRHLADTFTQSDLQMRTMEPYIILFYYIYIHTCIHKYIFIH